MLRKSDMKLSKDELLSRASNLQIRIVGESTFVTLDGETVSGGKHILKILDIFSKPISLDDALPSLSSSGIQDWIDLTAEIHYLYEHGILVSENASGRTYKPGRGFGALPVHVMMINDQARTHAFLSAIREVVRPGDVVVEIGTGTGLLSIEAAKAGAKHVYAIEATGIGEIAHEMFQVNGVADRVTLMTGWSTQVTLPEKADVLISEIIGNDIFEENVLESFSDAVMRHLKPHARMIPSQIDVLAQLLYIPEDALKTYSPVPSQCADWQRAYGIDFSPLMAASQSQYLYIRLKAHQARDWTLIGSPLCLAAINLITNTDLTLEASAEATAQDVHIVNAVMIYPDLKLTDNIHLARHIPEATEEDNWASAFYLLPKPLEFKAGEKYRVSYRTSHPRPEVRVERV